MTDGPHVSMPLPKPWQSTLNRACSLAYSVDQVHESFVHAVRSDYRDVPISEFRKIYEKFVVDGHFTPTEMVPEMIAGIGNQFAGKFPEGIVYECLGMALCDRQPSNHSFTDIMAAAIEESTKRRIRSLVEFSVTSPSRREVEVADVRERLAAAQDKIDLNAMAKEFCQQLTNGDRPRRIVVKRTGLEEGPQL